MDSDEEDGDFRPSDDEEEEETNGAEEGVKEEEERRKREEEEKKKKVSEIWARLRSRRAPASTPPSASSPTSTSTPTTTEGACAATASSVEAQAERAAKEEEDAPTAHSAEVSSDDRRPASPPGATEEPEPSSVVTQVFDFAGEDIVVTKPAQEDSLAGSKRKRPQKAAGSLDAVLAAVTGKKKKMSVFNKSQFDWDKYKDTEEGKQEVHEMEQNKKAGYLEKVAFLGRVDLRQHENEKSVRRSKRQDRSG